MQESHPLRSFLSSDNGSTVELYKFKIASAPLFNAYSQCQIVNVICSASALPQSQTIPLRPLSISGGCGNGANIFKYYSVARSAMTI